MPTPHIAAQIEDIASTVLMPGDPLRAEFIAKTYLENPVLFNNIRGMLGFTGTYKGKRVSVMGSGMGMPSIGIYSYELFSKYNVDNIIRIGSAGAYCEELDLNDLMLVTSAYSDSSFAKVQNGCEDDIIYPSKDLNERIINKASELGKKIVLGRIHSSDVFYQDTDKDYYKVLYKEKNTLAVEMESFALFHNALVLNKNAACMVTISDSFVKNSGLTALERQTSFDNMMVLALETV